VFELFERVYSCPHLLNSFGVAEREQDPLSEVMADATNDSKLQSRNVSLSDARRKAGCRVNATVTAFDTHTSKTVAPRHFSRFQAP
jgi:hypothetical protein